MSYDFEVVPSRRATPTVKSDDGPIIPASRGSRLEDAVADHFGQILDLAAGLVEMEKMKVHSDSVIREMEATRKTLLAQAEAYAKRINADTDAVVRRMQIVREMMRDFYQYNTNVNLTDEVFSKIISSIVSEMGRL